MNQLLNLLYFGQAACACGAIAHLGAALFCEWRMVKYEHMAKILKREGRFDEL